MSFWSAFPCSESDVLTMGLHKGEENSEVSVNLPYNDIDKITENIVNYSGCMAKSVFLRAMKLGAKGKNNWRKILEMTKNVKGGSDLCWHINSKFLRHTTLDSYTHAFLNLIILCTAFWHAWKRQIARRWLMQEASTTYGRSDSSVHGSEGMHGEEGSRGRGIWSARALMPFREICYLHVFGLASMRLAHDIGTMSMLGFSVWSGIGANCDKHRKCRKAMQILEEVNSRFGENGTLRGCCVVK